MSSFFKNIYLKEKITRRKLRKLRKEKRALFLEKKSKELQKETPESELWFYNKFNKELIPRIVGNHSRNPFKDQRNTPFQGLYIPDVLNEGYRYIIEVDGSSHDGQAAAYMDFQRDRSFIKRGYKVFRVRAYSEESYNKFIEEYKAYIEECHKGFLLGLYSKLTGITVTELSNNQRIYLNKNIRDVKLTETIILTSGIPEVKPKTILRKANG